MRSHLKNIISLLTAAMFVLPQWLLAAEQPAAVEAAAVAPLLVKVQTDPTPMNYPGLAGAILFVVALIMLTYWAAKNIRSRMDVSPFDDVHKRS